MPDNFDMGLLPERKMDWRTIATSYGIEALLIFFILFVGLLWPQHISFRQKYSITELIPPPAPRHKPAKAKPQHHPMVAKLLPPVFTAPKLIVPKEFRRPKKKEEKIEAPKLEAKFVTPVLPVQSAAMPARLVYTGSFGSSAPATVNAPVQSVQTGGFGDPSGLKGAGKDNAHLTATQTGSFDLPSGAGKGNGSGGAKGIQGTIASAGFGSGVAQSGPAKGQAVAQLGGFGTQQVGSSAPRRTVDNGPATTPVNITYKPNPNYTQEARNLQLQGEVLLEVVFGANGQLHVNRVVRGLGHGLDEAAVAAANKIQFKPALREGAPVDSTAVVHVVFELAM
jgi:TonB family protein